jgi:hypothetical protein
MLIPTQNGKDKMLRKFCLVGAVVAGFLFLPLKAHAGSAFDSPTPTTNPGGKYVHYGLTNPGGKYVYRGYGTTFHTNPGGKYVYPGYSAWYPGYSAWYPGYRYPRYSARYSGYSAWWRRSHHPRHHRFHRRAERPNSL